MRKERRWMTSVIKEAAKAKIDMPWARGEQRAAMIAKRADHHQTSASKAA